MIGRKEKTLLAVVSVVVPAMIAIAASTCLAMTGKERKYSENGREAIMG